MNSFGSHDIFPGTVVVFNVTGFQAAASVGRSFSGSAKMARTHAAFTKRLTDVFETTLVESFADSLALLTRVGASAFKSAAG